MKGIRRRALAASALIVALLLAVGCAGAPEEESSEDGSSTWYASSVSGISSAEPSASSESSFFEEISLEDFSEESSEEVSSEPPEVSEEEPEEFSPWRGEDEPNLEAWQSPKIPEEGFSFLKRDLTLQLGKSAVVAYEFKPLGTTNRTLTWSSSDEDVVRVENGRVTAVGIGRATVRAVTAGGRSAECRVTVVEPGTLSPVASLIETVAAGEFVGWQFSLYDAELDGTPELFVRRMDENGIPQVFAYRVSDGRLLLSTSTGVDEEWAIWRRDDGSRYLLLSYTCKTETGGTRYVLDEVVSSNGSPVFRSAFARETAPDGSLSYFAAANGSLLSCDEQTYQNKRKTYFSKNRQLPGTVLTWVSGLDVEEIERALNELKPLG